MKFKEEKNFIEKEIKKTENEVRAHFSGGERLIFLELQKCQIYFNELQYKYDKLLEFVKSISNHFNLNESEYQFMDFYTSKEQDANKLLKEIGEI